MDMSTLKKYDEETGETPVATEVLAVGVADEDGSQRGQVNADLSNRVNHKFWAFMVLMSSVIIALVVTIVLVAGDNNEQAVAPENSEQVPPPDDEWWQPPPDDMPWQNECGGGGPGCVSVVDGIANSFWEEDNYLCRMNVRPCDHVRGDDCAVFGFHADGGELFMDLRGAGLLNFDIIQHDSHDWGASEVWIVFATNEGTPQSNFRSCFRFRAEGREFRSEEWAGVSFDVNDYEIDSLECCEPQDDNSRIYIIIDGVLVDSCPKSVIEGCRV